MVPHNLPTTLRLAGVVVTITTAATLTNATTSTEVYGNTPAYGAPRRDYLSLSPALPRRDRAYRDLLDAQRERRTRGFPAGVELAAEEDVGHRDAKPENLLATEPPRRALLRPTSGWLPAARARRPRSRNRFRETSEAARA